RSRRHPQHQLQPARLSDRRNAGGCAGHSEEERAGRGRAGVVPGYEKMNCTRPPITLVVLTKDEEHNIAGCLASTAAFDDVHVLDSGSTDRTSEIAEAAGAKVWHNPFRGFGQQRNWAADHIPARYDWHLHLDADERLTPELVAE